VAVSQGLAEEADMEGDEPYIEMVEIWGQMVVTAGETQCFSAGNLIT
jgi:hypothetical protein